MNEAAHFELTIDADGTKHMSLDFSREQRTENRAAPQTRQIDDEAEKIFESNRKIEQIEQLFNQGKLIETIALCNKALELNPNNSWAYTFRGGAYFNMREFQRALENFNKAIELDAQNAVAYYDRGNTYEHLNNRSAAIADFTKAIELTPTSWEAYHYRGVTLGGGGL